MKGTMQGTITEFFEKHKITGSAKHYAKAMLLANASEEDILRVVSPMQANKPTYAPSLACPSCNSTMSIAKLFDNRKVTYCPNDRVCLPVQV